METYDLYLFVIELLMCAGLFLLAKYAELVRNTRWKLMYLAPMAFAVIMLSLGGFEVSMLPAYAAGILCAAGFFKEQMSVRRIVSGISLVLVMASLVICFNNPGYREPDYAGQFEEAFAQMKNHYILGEHKDIDWDMLHQTYQEKFRTAKKEHDPVENVIAWRQFCNEFHDGHVSYMTDEELLRQANEKMMGNDYGLSLVALSDGSTAAVNVEEKSEAYEAGIRNGSEITGWDGGSLADAASKVDMAAMDTMPLKENEDFYRRILTAGVGGEENHVTFVDAQGNEKSVTLHRIGSYYDRFMKTVDIIDQGVTASDLSFVQMDEETYVLRIKNMMYDMASYENGNHSEMQETLRDKLIELKQQGVEHLIIDLRGNGGGSPQMIMAIAELFAPEGTCSYAYEGIFHRKNMCYERGENGRYKVGDAFTFVGENVWENRKVTILVNARSVSAADHFVYIMKSLNQENVRIVGFTQSNASAQAISGIRMSDGQLTYSCVPALTENGDILIDPDSSREGGIELDTQVPVDDEAIKALFDEGEDYLLRKAMEP